MVKRLPDPNLVRVSLCWHLEDSLLECGAGTSTAVEHVARLGPPHRLVLQYPMKDAEGFSDYIGFIPDPKQFELMEDEIEDQ